MASAKESSIHSEATISLLRELALALGLVWKRHSDRLWRQIDPDIWLTTRNPWLMLQQAPEQMLDSIASDNGLRRHVEQLVLSRRETCNSAGFDRFSPILMRLYLNWYGLNAFTLGSRI
jgi:hypothetical protein